MHGNENISKNLKKVTIFLFFLKMAAGVEEGELCIFIIFEHSLTILDNIKYLEILDRL